MAGSKALGWLWSRARAVLRRQWREGNPETVAHHANAPPTLAARRSRERILCSHGHCSKSPKIGQLATKVLHRGLCVGALPCIGPIALQACSRLPVNDVLGIRVSLKPFVSNVMFGHGQVFVPAYAELIEVDDLRNLGPQLLTPCWSEHLSALARSHFATLHLGKVAAMDTGVTQQWRANTSAVVNVLEVLVKISNTFAATLCLEKI